MASPSPDTIRERLDALGEERKALSEEEEKLARKVERVLGTAYGKVSVAEAARRLGMHRTTVYRVYHPHDS